MNNENVYEIDTIDSLVNHMLLKSKDSIVYKKIATYVEQNYVEMIFMTADELATELSISQGSVSKFCIAIGFKGYSEFMKNLQKIVGKEITAPDRLSFSKKHHNTLDFIEKEMDNFKSIDGIIESKEYQELVDKLAKSKKVILLSARISATLLPYLKYGLGKVRNNIEIVTPQTNEWNYLSVDENVDDAFVLLFSMPRYPRALLAKAEELSEKGYEIGVITDSRFSPFCNYGKINIFVPRTVAPVFDIYSTPILFFNILIGAVSRKIDNVNDRIDKIEMLDKENKIYL